MKLSKLYSILLMLAAILLFAACNDYVDTEETSPSVSEGCQGVYFPSSNTSAFEMEPTETTEITLTIARTNTTSAADIPITVETNDSSIFTVPETVSFSAGDTAVDFTITFPNAAEGTTYNLNLTVDGDDYVNTYSAEASYLETSVTRIKWETVSEPIVYVDGTFATLWGVDIVAMYVEAEKAELASVTRYRFKNAYNAPTSVDDDGIYDGYRYTSEDEFDTSTDYYTIIEIDASNNVYMYPHDIGVDWDYGMISIGCIYPDVSDDNDTYPWGTLEDDVITFPSQSLYFSMADYNSGSKYSASTPTYIYFNKDDYLAANMAIDDYNSIDYDLIAGDVGLFESAAYSSTWNQAIYSAVNVDSLNEESEYLDLYYLSDLYASGYGVAFYCYEEDNKIIIPENQPIGTTTFGKAIYVSASNEVESSFAVSTKGVKTYTLGLTFHYEDGTVLGDFAEVFYYSEDAIVYSKDNYLGDFILSGTSPWGYDDAAMSVTITEDDNSNLIIEGVDYADSIYASFNTDNSSMIIYPQYLPDYGSYDITLYTYDGSNYSTDSLAFALNPAGVISVASTSPTSGYLLYSSAAGGFIDGYYDLILTPDTEKAAKLSTSLETPSALGSMINISETKNETMSNIKLQGKLPLKR